MGTIGEVAVLLQTQGHQKIAKDETQNELMENIEQQNKYKGVKCRENES